MISKNIIFYIAAICLLLFSITNITKAIKTGETSKPKIYISQFVKHPALDATVQGIIDGLEKYGYSNNENIELVIDDAQGNITLANQIANKFIGKDPDIVVGVATISAQSFIKYTRSNQTKLIFTSVTDPIDAGLVDNIKNPGGNITGVSNFIPFEPQIEMFLNINPSIKKLGFLYNPGELNSISIIKQLEKILPKYSIELVSIAANKTSDIPQSAAKLAEISDAIFISNDNTALSAFKTIVKAANTKSIPVFVSDVDIVKDGAVAALGASQYDLGLQTAKMISDALSGKDIGNMQVEYPNVIELYLNSGAAKKLGIKLDGDLLKSATQIIE